MIQTKIAHQISRKKIIESKNPSDKEKKYMIMNHSGAQAILLIIGNMLGYDTYVALEDRNKKFDGISLGDIAVLKNIPTFSNETTLETAKHIDVIWFEDEHPYFCFEVEESTNVTQGLTRLADLKHFNVSTFIVGSEKKRRKFNKEISRISFRKIQYKTKFINYNKLEKFYEITKQFIKLKTEILD